jgi:hypothetical protein
MHSRLLLLLTLSALTFSCATKPSGVPSVVLMSQPLHDQPNGTIVGGAGVGAVVYYLGEMSPDKRDVKVDYNGTVGWISSVAVIRNSKPAIVTGSGAYYFSPDNANSAATLSPGTIVAMDTIVNDRAHIHFSLTFDSFGDAWIAASDLNTNPDEIAFAIELEDISDQSKQARATRYAQMFPKHPRSPLITEVSIDLSEATDEAIADMQRTLPIVLDKPNNKLLTVRSEVEAQVTGYGDDILAGPVQFSFAAIKPRSTYYQRYVTQLPKFVSLPSVSDYAGYIDKLSNEQSWRAYLLFRVDRSPENIRKLYDAYGGILRQVVSKYPIGVYVSALIQTYDHITRVPDYKKVCADIRSGVDAWDKSHKVDGGFTEGGYILEAQHSIYEPILAPAIENTWDVTSSTWYHSFWVRRLAEGNAEIVYNILQDLAALNFPKDSREEGEGEGEEESFGDSPIEATTSVCTYQEYAMGDCSHVVFDCGDYGDANPNNLSEEDLTLWSSLFVEGTEGTHTNPDMVGKKFEIKEYSVPGTICGEEGGTEGNVPRLVSFKLVN